jgi:uncharacterized protein YdaU (DUF1376 family)
MNKPPAFMLYADDWLGSKQIALMTPEQEGAYIHLLCHEWNDDECALPTSDADLAVLSRLGRKWNKNKERILACFYEEGGKLYNAKLLGIWQDLMAQRKRCSEGGKKAQRQRKGSSKVAATTLQAPTQGGTNIPTPSTSSSTIPRESNDSLSRARGQSGVTPEFLENHPEYEDIMASEELCSLDPMHYKRLKANYPSVDAKQAVAQACILAANQVGGIRNVYSFVEYRFKDIDKENRPNPWEKPDSGFTGFEKYEEEDRRNGRL